MGRTIFVKRITLFAVFYHTHVRLKGDENMMPPEPPTVNPKALDFGNLSQGNYGEPLQVVICNPDKQRRLLWHADTCGTRWLRLDMLTGNLEPGKQQTVTVTVDTSSLAIGNHEATLIFTSEGDASSESIQVPVTLSVLPSGKTQQTVPSFVVSPLAVGLNFARFLNSSKTLPLAISNQDGQAPVKWTADNSGTRWLNLDRWGGTLQPGEQQTIFVTANTGSLPLGDKYAATLTFTTNGVGSNLASIQIQAKLHVSPEPFGDDGPHAPVAKPVRFDFNTQQASGKLVITNPNANPQVNWAMDTGGVNWVTLSTSKGTLQAGGQAGGHATVNVMIDTSLLPHQAGTYKTDLKVTFTFSPGGNSTSTLVPVTMTVP